MTREEQIETIARSLYNPTIDAERGKIKAFIEGAKWSERNQAAIEFKIASESYHRSKLVDWQQVRIQAAIAAMQGFCNVCHDSVIREIQESSDKERSNVISFLAVRMADALVKELKGEQP